MSVDDDEKPIATHLPCDDCGSSDALTEYPTHTYCFSCGTRKNTDGDDNSSTTSSRSANNSSNGDSLYRVEYSALVKRGITEETCKFWSYGLTEIQGKRVHCAQYKDHDRKVVAQKLRFKDKTFPWVNRKSFKGLYGQWLWRDGGKKVVITEGELDALSVSQCQGNKWPVVSLPDGGGKNAVKPIQEALSWLQGFDEIILFFDSDDKGRETVDLVKNILPIGKVFIAVAPEGYKDANDMLMDRKTKELIDCIWSAKKWTPAGIVTGKDIIARAKDRPEIIAYPFPDYMPKLNYISGGGLRLGELTTWTSGTGMGKTTIIKALQNHFFHTTVFNQALVHLEEPLEDTVDDLIAYEVGKRFQLDPEGNFRETKEYDEAADRLFLAQDAAGFHRLQLYDAFGSVDDDDLFNIIRYMAKGCGCQIIWLDHLSILVSEGDAGDDERKRIDRIMHKLKAITVELNIHIGLISHLRKPSGNGKSFEEGAVPSLDDLRGSGGIKQLSNNVFAISRNQQAANETERNTSLLTSLKCRKTGRTGAADYLTFSDETGRLEAGLDPTTNDFNDESSNDENADY